MAFVRTQEEQIIIEQGSVMSVSTGCMARRNGSPVGLQGVELEAKCWRELAPSRANIVQSSLLEFVS